MSNEKDNLNMEMIYKLGFLWGELKSLDGVLTKDTLPDKDSLLYNNYKVEICKLENSLKDLNDLYENFDESDDPFSIFYPVSLEGVLMDLNDLKSLFDLNVEKSG